VISISGANQRLLQILWMLTVGSESGCIWHLLRLKNTMFVMCVGDGTKTPFWNDAFFIYWDGKAYALSYSVQEPWAEMKGYTSVGRSMLTLNYVYTPHCVPCWIAMYHSSRWWIRHIHNVQQNLSSRFVCLCEEINSCPVVNENTSAKIWTP
jgi:hypothetical protein